MRKILTAILFCFFLLPITTNAESLNYTSQQYHYTFTIPSGWTVIPKSTIDEVMQQTSDISGGQFINYTTGFQLENAEIFQYPYILVREHTKNTIDYKKIVNMFNTEKFSKSTQKNEENIDMIINSSIQNPLVDKQRDIIFINGKVNIADVGEVNGLMVYFLGKDSITQLNFSFIDQKNLSIFNQIIDSFQYEQGYDYDKKEAKNTESKNFWGNYISELLAFSIIGILIFIASKVLRAFKNKK